MKYASEVIDLLAAYPNRAFKMIQIVRHVADGHPESPKEWERVRKGVRRVLDSLEESGQVSSNRLGATNGGSVLYQWKPGHELLANRDVNRESPRVLRRLQPLRKWSHYEQAEQVFP